MDESNGRDKVMMYLWTAPGRAAAAVRSASGVSDDAYAARQAAEVLLHAGQAAAARIECAYAAADRAVNHLGYVPTGIGWSGRVGRAGRVVWTPFTDPVPGSPAR